MMSFVADFGMTPEARRAPAAHRRLRAEPCYGRRTARAGHPARAQSRRANAVVEPSVLPINFACPNLIAQRDGTRIGISDAASPWSAALAQA